MMTSRSYGRRKIRPRQSAAHLLMALGLAYALMTSQSARAATLDGTDSAQPVAAGTLLLADELTYDESGDILTATGSIEIQRGNVLLMADKIVYDRRADIATATGHVSILESNGSVMFFESIHTAALEAL